MADLTPHPLIEGIGAGLDLAADGKKLIDAEIGAVGTPAGMPAVGSAAAQLKSGVLTEPADDTAKENIVGVAAASNIAALVTFAGYVGPLLKKSEKYWCVFYLDTRLQSWLLVDVDGIVFRDPIKDDQAPCGIRDVLWVKADTIVGSGSGFLSLEAQFLTGAFTQAGDFDAGPSGGTLAAATGVFCEARSVGCCRPKTPRT
jgi:hypothetical protein